MVGVRALIAVAFPTFAALIGFLWFRRKKKDPAIEPSRPEAEATTSNEATGSQSSPGSVKVKGLTDCVPPGESTSKSSEGPLEEEIQPEKITAVQSAPVESKTPQVSSSKQWAEQMSLESEDITDGNTAGSSQGGAENGKKEEVEAESTSNNNNRQEDRVKKAEHKGANNREKGNMKILQREKSPVVSSNSHKERNSPQHRDVHPSKPNRTGSSSKADRKRERAGASPMTGVGRSPQSKAHQSRDAKSRNFESNNHYHEAIEREVSEVNQKSNPRSTGRHSSGTSLESPVENGSNGSDVQSELSADSGRGPSLGDLATPPVLETREIVVFQFDFPTRLCGKLIGKNGRNVNVIKDRSEAEIAVKRKLQTQEYQLVQLKGSMEQVEIALNLIKQRFPPRKFRISYKEVMQDEEGPVLPAEIMQLGLPEGCTVDVIVSSVVTPNHVFVQQPTHPTFPMLEKQNQFMMMCYAQDGIVPQLPRPIEVGVICAAPMFNGWYRAQIVQSYAETDECDIKFVDYGGYLRVANCLLRQIRSDFTSLPFQAVECYMANVVPPKDLDTFPSEANAMLEQMVHGKLVQAEIVGHEEDGVPYVQLYEYTAEGPVFVNRELVNQGVACWLELQSDPCL